MVRWVELLGRIGRVRTFDYDYLREGRRRVDRLPVLVAAHRAALAETRAALSGPIVLIGRSMGSRIGCHLSLEEPVSALVCLSYPLCGGGDVTKLRDKVLRELTTPILFVQGTRDPLCPLQLLEQTMKEMAAPNELYVVEGGDHSLLVTKKQLALAAETQSEVEERILAAIAGFVTKQVRPARENYLQPGDQK